MFQVGDRTARVLGYADRQPSAGYLLSTSQELCDWVVWKEFARSPRYDLVDGDEGLNTFSMQDSFI